MNLQGNRSRGASRYTVKPFSLSVTKSQGDPTYSGGGGWGVGGVEGANVNAFQK